MRTIRYIGSGDISGLYIPFWFSIFHDLESPTRAHKGHEIISSCGEIHGVYFLILGSFLFTHLDDLGISWTMLHPSQGHAILWDHGLHDASWVIERPRRFRWPHIPVTSWSDEEGIIVSENHRIRELQWPRICLIVMAQEDEIGTNQQWCASERCCEWYGLKRTQSTIDSPLAITNSRDECITPTIIREWGHLRIGEREYDGTSLCTCTSTSEELLEDSSRI